MSSRTRRFGDLWADLSHVVAGLAIALLGLAVTVGVTWAGTPEAEADSRPSSTRMGDGSTAAEPLPDARDIDRETQAERRGADQDGGGEADDGTLERYEPKTGATERNPVGEEMQKGRAQQQEKERRRQEEARGQEVSETSRERLGRSRAADQQADKEAITAEQERLEEEKRRKEEEARRLAEERRNGTLRDGEYEGPYTGPVSGEVSGSGGARPVTGRYTIAARWGAVGSWSRYHTGIDLSAPIGRPVVAAADGTVRAPVGGGWAGIHVIIEHANGDATLYAHLASTTVRPGQTVRAGEVIGAIGMTGRTFGPHLHFEYYPSARSASNPYSTSDPYTWMLTRGVRL